MTQPAPDMSFSIDPQAKIIALTMQRNEAQDQAADWRAAAIQERQKSSALAARVAELESAAQVPAEQESSTG